MHRTFQRIEDVGFPPHLYLISNDAVVSIWMYIHCGISHFICSTIPSINEIDPDIMVETDKIFDINYNLQLEIPNQLKDERIWEFRIYYTHRRSSFATGFRVFQRIRSIFDYRIHATSHILLLPNYAYDSSKSSSVLRPVKLFPNLTIAAKQSIYN